MDYKVGPYGGIIKKKPEAKQGEVHEKETMVAVAFVFIFSGCVAKNHVQFPCESELTELASMSGTKASMEIFHSELSKSNNRA
ncbi:MAG: hypothetical protein ACTTJS_07750 [Wolinella sp.]